MKRGPFPLLVSAIVALWSLLQVTGATIAMVRGYPVSRHLGVAIIYTLLLGVSVYGFVNRYRAERRR